MAGLGDGDAWQEGPSSEDMIREAQRLLDSESPETPPEDTPPALAPPPPTEPDEGFAIDRPPPGLRGTETIPAPIEGPEPPPTRRRSRWPKVAIPAVVLAGLALVGALFGTDEATERYNEGVEHSEAGRWQAAVVAYTDVIEMEPGDVNLLAQAYVNRGASLAELGNHEESFADASTAINLDPEDSEILAQAYANRAAGHAHLGRAEDAIADATAALDLDPQELDTAALAHVNRAHAFLQLEQFEEADRDSSAAIGLDPEDHDTLAMAYLNQSAAYSGLGKTEDALVAAATAIDLEPADPVIVARAYVNRAHLLNQLERYDEAVTEASTAIDVEPADLETVARAHLNRAAALGSLGRFEEAAADATVVIDTLPEESGMLPGAYWVRALSHNALGDANAALADIDAALSVASNDEALRSELERMRGLLGGASEYVAYETNPAGLELAMPVDWAVFLLYSADHQTASYDVATEQFGTDLADYLKDDAAFMRTVSGTRVLIALDPITGTELTIGRWVRSGNDTPSYVQNDLETAAAGWGGSVESFGEVELGGYPGVRGAFVVPADGTNPGVAQEWFVLWGDEFTFRFIFTIFSDEETDRQVVDDIMATLALLTREQRLAG